MTEAGRRAAILVVAFAAAIGCRTPASSRERERERERGERGERDAGGDASGDAVGTGRPCGVSGSDCAPEEYCAFTPRLCGKGKRPGVCRRKPSACGDAYGPVCGCDRKVYGSACEANAAGIDLAVNGGCAAKVPDWIACGPTFCNARTHYCEIVLSDVFELPTDSTCKPLPPACVPEGGAARTCDCFPEGTRCRSFCGHLENGGVAGFHLTCRL